VNSSKKIASQSESDINRLTNGSLAVERNEAKRCNEIKAAKKKCTERRNTEPRLNTPGKQRIRRETLTNQPKKKNRKQKTKEKKKIAKKIQRGQTCMERMTRRIGKEKEVF